jgi:hypothetical protein
MKLFPTNFRFVRIDLPQEMEDLIQSIYEALSPEVRGMVSSFYFSDMVSAQFLGERVKNYLATINELRIEASNQGVLNYKDAVELFIEYRRSILEYVQCNMYYAIQMAPGTALELTEVVCFFLAGMLEGLANSNTPPVPVPGQSTSVPGPQVSRNSKSSVDYTASALAAWRDIPSLFDLLSSYSGIRQKNTGNATGASRSNARTFTRKQLIREIEERMVDISSKVYQVGSLFDIARSIQASLDLALGGATEESHVVSTDVDFRKIQSLSELPNQVIEYPEEMADSLALSKNLRVQKYARRVKGKISAAIAFDVSGSINDRRETLIKGCVMAYGQRVAKEGGVLDIAYFHDWVSDYLHVTDDRTWSASLKEIFEIETDEGTDIDRAVASIAERITMQGLDHGILITDGTQDMVDTSRVPQSAWDKITVICLDSMLPNLREKAAKYFRVDSMNISAHNFASIFYEIEK